MGTTLPLPTNWARWCLGCGAGANEGRFTACPHCGAEKCPTCDMGDDVECPNCEGDEK